MQVYTTIQQHHAAINPPPLIPHSLSLQDQLCVAAPTGVAAFNIDCHTLHSLLSLPTRGDFKDLEGERLNKLQQSIWYIIIEDVHGWKTLGQVDRRLRQAFPHYAVGGCSCLLFGDFGPVMDLPLYTINSRTVLSDLGRTAYQTGCHSRSSHAPGRSGSSASTVS